MFSGSCVALVTPFSGNRVDDQKIGALVDFHIKNGTSAVVPCGTTGESATLSHDEHAHVIEVVVKAAAGKIKVLAGAGSNSTEETIEMTLHAKEAGADGVLLIVPYYNKPTQRGIIEHYSAVARSVSIPMVLYNIPSRTGVNMIPETVIHLAREFSHVVGIKEASGSLDQVSEILMKLSGRFDLLSGDDSLTYPMLSLGAKGVISVVANIVPQDVAGMIKDWEKKDYESAKQKHFKLYELTKALFVETSPTPVKTAMGLMGLCAPDVRLPMTAMESQNKVRLAAAMRDYGLIKEVPSPV